jgi:hypothetical protein
MINATPPLSRNQFRCFQCRLVFAQRDGDWFYLGEMQVHLCRGCEKISKKETERADRCFGTG